MKAVQIQENSALAGSRVGLQRHYFDGAFRESFDGRTFETLNPSTNEVLAQAADGGAAEIDAAVGAARRAQVHLRTVEPDLAVVREVHAAEDLYERALGRAVLADEGVDLALAELE